MCHGDFPEYTPEHLLEILAENWNRRSHDKLLRQVAVDVIGWYNAPIEATKQAERLGVIVRDAESAIKE
jgi:hypothetical protein